MVSSPLLLLSFASNPPLPCSLHAPVLSAKQVSVAGRDNFLAVEADHALAAVVGGASEAKAVSALLASLASKSPDVRAKAALHLDACLQQRGPQLVGPVS